MYSYILEYDGQDAISLSSRDTPIVILDVDLACDDDIEGLTEFLTSIADVGMRIKIPGWLTKTNKHNGTKTVPKFGADFGHTYIHTYIHTLYFFFQISMTINRAWPWDSSSLQMRTQKRGQNQPAHLRNSIRCI